jgi:hypothetical protein
MTRGLRPRQLADLKYQLPNLLDNGGFEVWQRGAGPFTGAWQPTADRWWGYTTGTATIQRSTDAKEGNYSMEYVQSAGANGSMRQSLENFQSLEGQYLTFSMWVKTSSLNAARLSLYDWNGVSAEAENGEYHTGSGEWERLSVTKLIRTGLASGYGSTPHTFGLLLYVHIAGGCTVKLDGATCVVGNFPEGVPYAPEHPADEIEKCERFCEYGWTRRGFISNGPYNSSGVTIMAGIAFKTYKQATPVMTYTSVTGIYNNWYGFYSTNSVRTAMYFRNTNSNDARAMCYWKAEVV